MRRPRHDTYQPAGEDTLGLPDLTHLSDVPPTMFGGYPEVAGLYMEEDFISPGPEAEGRGPIPTDYIPVYSPPDPWNSSSTCKEDFILVAEFSEQEGPKPLITIPEKAGGDFDLNEFSVRIMSVDYQGMAGDAFSTSQDTQVILSESHHNMYAYVHHFTLHDSQARGFVRPFCMSYVTPTHRKLGTFYDQMNMEFSKVSQCFRYGNLMMFVRDMTHYLSDLHYTKERYIERSNALSRKENIEKQIASIELGDEEEEAILESVTPQSIDCVIDEVRAILETTTDLMEYERLSHANVPHDAEKPKESTEQLDADNFRYSCSLHSNSSSNSQFADSNIASVLLDRNASYDEDGIYRPKVVRTTSKKRFDKSLRTLHELCQHGAKEGLNRLDSIYKFFSREMCTLDMERTDSCLINPPAGLLTIGRCVQLNFLARLKGMGQTESQFSSCGDMLTASSLTESSMGKWLSNDTFGSVGSFHSAESFLSCQDDPSLPGMGPKSAYQPTLCVGSLNLTESTNTVSKNSTTPLSDVKLESNTTNKFHSQAANAISETQSICSGFSTTESERGQTTEGTGDMGGKVDSSVSGQDPMRVSVISTADHVSNITPSCPGYGILDLANKYKVCPEMCFSLLSGRPLVIVGSPKMEEEIRAVLTALWIFVPGHSKHREQVIPWTTKPLRITDLRNTRLIGLGKSEKRTLDSVLPSSVRSYVSMLDIEKKILSGPPYKGGLLTDIYNKRKVFQDDASYIAYIHGILNEFGLKAYTFYHGFTMNAAAVSDSHKTNPCQRQAYQLARSGFCNRLKLSEEDVHIVQYLSNVVKEQQIYEMNVQRFAENEMPVTSITLDYSVCKTFKRLT